MSTKVSLYYDPKIHLYQESFRDDSIYLSVNEKGIDLKIEFPLVDFIKMIQSIDLNSLKKQSNITDQEIESYCEKQVEKRISLNNDICQMFGYMIYGDCKESKEKQITNGIKYHKDLREKIKKIIEELGYNKNNYYFGLEDILD